MPDLFIITCTSGVSPARRITRTPPPMSDAAALLSEAAGSRQVLEPWCEPLEPLVAHQLFGHILASGFTIGRKHLVKF